MDSRPVHARGRFPWEVLAVFAWLVVSVGGSIVTLWALVLYLRTPEPAPAPAAAAGEVAAATRLETCQHAELVIIVEDNSVSVRDLDPSDERLAAVRSLVDLLNDEPCTADDLVSVVSFTDQQAVTGPASAAGFGPIERASGHGTDIGGAVDRALAVSNAHPDHRPVVILLSDLEEQSTVPLEDTLQRLDRSDMELILVSIGDVEHRPGTTQFALRNTSSIAADLVAAINRSRSQT